MDLAIGILGGDQLLVTVVADPVIVWGGLLVVLHMDTTPLVVFFKAVRIQNVHPRSRQTSVL